jgi:hypothetical protein
VERVFPRGAEESLGASHERRNESYTPTPESSKSAQIRRSGDCEKKPPEPATLPKSSNEAGSFQA